MKEKALRFDLISALVSGVTRSPQEEMNRLRLNNYYRAELNSIGEFCLFFFKEWPSLELPGYLHKVEIDYSPRDVDIDYSGCIFLPGDKVKNKKTGRLALVEYDYATAFWGTDHQSISLCELDINGEIYQSWAWAYAIDYEIIDSGSREKNLAKIRDYHKGHSVPYYISKEMARIIYGRDFKSL